VELRGLQPGTYHVTDYANDKDMGTVTVTTDSAVLPAEFKDNLLLEVSK
jgi:hypothetical protein